MVLLTNFWNEIYYNNTIEDWSISLAIILGGIIAAKILYWISGKFLKALTSKTRSKLDDILVDKLEEPVVFGVVLGASWYALSLLSFSSTADDFIEKMLHFIFVVNITWLLVRTMDSLIEEYLMPLVEKSDSELDDQIMPIVRKGVKSMIWILGVIVALNNAGYNVGALIAGLGIGGLALALAAQDTVKNVFGGIMIFVDKPFKMGERIKINGFDGTISEIGLRTTRLKTLEGRIVMIPNSTFMDQCIENVSREPARKVALNLGLTYDTTPEQMNQAIDILYKILEDHKEWVTEDTWTSFNQFGDFALGIQFSYFIKKEADITKTESMMSTAILERFNKAGLEFAYPTQTIFKKELV